MRYRTRSLCNDSRSGTEREKRRDRVNAIFNSEICPANFSASCKDRNSNKGGGGVFIALRNDLICTLQIEVNTDCEIICIKLQLANYKSILVGSFYRPSDKNDTKYLENL